MSAHPSTLYSETVLAHNRAPKNCGSLVDATHHGVAENAMCGDHLKLSFRVHGNVIAAAMFDGDHSQCVDVDRSPARREPSTHC